MCQLQTIADANERRDQYRAQLEYLTTTRLPEVLTQAAALNQQQLQWMRGWVKEAAEPERMLPMQIESEKNNWQTRSRQREEKAAPIKQDEQERRQAMEQCDEAVRQMIAGKEEADKLIRQRKAIEGELKVQ